MVLTEVSVWMRSYGQRDPVDTMIGVSRRSWGRCEHSIETVAEYNKIREGQDYITMPYLADEDMIERVCKDVVVEEHHAHH